MPPKCLPYVKGSKPVNAPRIIPGWGWEFSSLFGQRKDPITGLPGNHGGLDVPIPFRLPTHAMDDGIFRPYPNGSTGSGGGGNWAGLECTDGAYWAVGHLDEFNAEWGQPVSAGDLIGWGNSTGQSTGNHGHIAYRKPGQGFYSDPWDPIVALAAIGAFPDGSFDPHNPNKSQPDCGCGPGQGEDFMPGYQCCYDSNHPKAGDFWWIVGNTAAHVASPAQLEINRTQQGAPIVNSTLPDGTPNPKAGEVHAMVIDGCLKVYPENQ